MFTARKMRKILESNRNLRGNDILSKDHLSHACRELSHKYKIYTGRTKFLTYTFHKQEKWEEEFGKELN